MKLKPKTYNQKHKDRNEDIEDTARLISRMAYLLTETANALKGKPKPLCLHSWHDLPKIAKKIMKERNVKG